MTSIGPSGPVWVRLRSEQLLMARVRVPRLDVSSQRLQQNLEKQISVCLWQYDPSSHEVQLVTSLSGHASGVKAVDCDAVRCITASRDRTLRIWAMKTGEETGVIRLAGWSFWQLWPQPFPL